MSQLNESKQHARLMHPLNTNNRPIKKHDGFGAHIHNQHRLRVYFKLDYVTGVDAIPLTHAQAALGSRAHNPYYMTHG